MPRASRRPSGDAISAAELVAASGGSPPRRPRRRPATSLLRRIVITAVSFTVLLVVGTTAVAAAAYKHFDGQITRVSVLHTDDSHIREAAQQVDAQNFLLIGSDTRAGADAGYGQDVVGARSDTTILVHLARNADHATIVSFPRDSWVTVPACTDSNGTVHPEHQGMFNSAFTEGGASCTVSTVQQLTGIEVTHYVQVDFVGFKSMVDALGSVTICSPQAVQDPGSGLRLQPGDNQLDGDQALAYVRARETLGDGSDLGRIKRQQLFLGAVLRQAMSGHLLSDPARLTSFLDAATKAVTVDTGTSFQDLRTLAGSVQGLDPARVTFYTAPIADPDYSPPGTDETGRVLLDDAAGRRLYDSVIADVPLPAATSTPAPTAGAPTSPTATVSPTPSSTPTGVSGADTACQI